MHELTSIYSNIENNLNNKYYFQSLVKEGHERKILSDQRVEHIQLSLFRLLKDHVNRYTSYESSSVRTEKAQQLLQSICYTIGAYLKTIQGIKDQLELLDSGDMDELFSSGTTVLKKYIEESKISLKKLQSEALYINNLAYHNTIFTGIPEYFKDCDIKYAPQDDAGSIDYPLSVEITDLEGVEYIREYLHRLNLENTFCKFFNVRRIEQLLNGYHTDYPDLLINIFEIILINVIGLVLLNKDIYQLNISEEDRYELKIKLQSLTADQLQTQLKQAVLELYNWINTDNYKLLQYMLKNVYPISRRLTKLLSMDKLEMIFFSLRTVQKKSEPDFRDGNMMEDDKLRDLIEEMQNCRYISDKITMIKNQVHSLRDLIEVMEVCFYGEEFIEIFKMLTDNEITALLNYLNDEEEKEWQKALLKYKKDYLSSPAVNISKRRF
ncbi:DUF6179 domain-containing protein [Anaerocolumna sp. MB42-C2]|uniref:DUF6179 domain-containing protein n=1 Tax=Anaerocolumna sp. MB42-C2 TaxID=3070997 RepID=UPI0027DFFE8F|nr:DUF6179 domain-containing protein [Anaerocolumna sp. MB42-C2]WMJ86633.1 DUF6179 domain-containing protein [Anaerocolumna sp. MB42-C2]